MTSPTHTHLSRRGFLKMMGAAGAVVVGGQILSTYSPWLDYDKQARQAKQVNEDGTSNQLLALIHNATLAANSHNSQPWKFAIKDNAIEIHPDYTRRLPVVDPNDRELWISLGCALENLLIAAQAVGYSAELNYPVTTDFIHVELTPDTPKHDTLVESIPLRQSTRSEYDGRSVNTFDFDQLQKIPLESSVALQFVSTPGDMGKLGEYVNQGTLIQYADKAFVEELIHWLRFNRREILNNLDGLYSVCSGNPEVPRWLGALFVSGTDAQQQADLDVKKLRSSSGAIIIHSATEDKVSWVRTGQVYERLALKMTSLNIKSALLNQPIEVSTLRGQFQSAMGLGGSIPQLLMRFGYAEAMPISVRRPQEQVLL